MGRKSHNHQIHNSVMGPIMDKMKPSLKDQIRTIAKEKGISMHLLIELYLERCVKEYQIKGF